MNDRTLTVGELAEALRIGLEQLFPYGVWVEGEISGISRPRNGHVYFDLIEPAEIVGRPPLATVPVVLFRDARDRVNRLLKRHGDPIRMDDGVKIRIQGMVDFYPPTGKLQLRMTAIDPTYTLGRLAAERDALLRLLAAENLLRRNAALPVPALPLRVGLVTSVGSAAHADVTTVLRSSDLGFTIVEADTPVQGQGAEERIAAAIQAACGAGVDVVIIARGGGSRTDLATFDHEAVARAIATAPVPVFAGLGHEIDRSVADEVAHSSHPTPTAAAQEVVALVRNCLFRLDETAALVADRARRAVAATEARIAGMSLAFARGARGGLDRADESLTANRTRLVVGARAGARSAELRLDRATAAVVRRAPRVLVGADRDLATLATRVRALDPTVALARGWSITRTADGSIVRSVADVEPGDLVTTQVSDGMLESTIRPPEPQDEGQPR